MYAHQVFLTLKQKESHLTICLGHKNLSTDDNFTKNIITGNKTPAYWVRSGKKLQSSLWKTKFYSWQKKAHQVKSNVKTMLIVFLYLQNHNVHLKDNGFKM